MANERKIWETLSAIPCPFEPGVVYVTQKLAGVERDINNPPVNMPNSTAWSYAPRETFMPPVTRVQRCRLHANGRLENTDVAPDKINDTHKVQVVRGDGSGHWNFSHWGMAPGDELTVKSEDGEVLDRHVEPEKRWLSDEVPMPPVMALGVLRQWLKTPGTYVAVLGHGDLTHIKRNFIQLLSNHGGVMKGLGGHLAVFDVSGGFIKVNYADGSKKSSRVRFFGSNDPDRMRGHQAHHFLVEAAVISADSLPEDSSGLDALDNLRLMTRLGDSPDGVVLDRF